MAKSSIPPSPFERKHRQLLNAIERKIQQAFQGLHLSASQALEGIPFESIDPEEGFDLSRYPTLEAQINNLTKKAQREIISSISQAIRSTYAVSTDKAIDLVKHYLGDKDGRLYINTLQRSGGAVAFQKRWFDNHPISQKVWNITDQFKSEVEERVTADLLTGTPADQISRNLRNYLNEPNKLFRRQRGAGGVLRLSKNARAYHPGQGVYRSSYKNARRLALTEVNNAYRKADSDRWQQLDFVIGVRVQLSNNHTYRDHKGRLRTLVDICDDLKGDYPKDFQFTSWHPHCRCIATPILKTREEMKRDRQLIREGKAPEGSKKEVKELPENFKAWQQTNAKRIAKATKRGTLPHWLRDNFKPRENGKLTYRPPAKATTIQQVWLKRNRQRSLQEAKEALIGGTAYHPQIGEVHFTTKGIKEAINQPHRDLYHKNRAIKNAKQLIEKGEYLGTAEDSKNRKAIYHYIKTKIERGESFVVIKETAGGNVFYTITDTIKK